MPINYQEVSIMWYLGVIRFLSGDVEEYPALSIIPLDEDYSRALDLKHDLLLGDYRDDIADYIFTAESSRQAMEYMLLELDCGPQFYELQKRRQNRAKDLKEKR